MQYTPWVESMYACVPSLKGQGVAGEESWYLEPVEGFNSIGLGCMQAIYDTRSGISLTYDIA
jgi:hypothetical protein